MDSGIIYNSSTSSGNGSASSNGRQDMKSHSFSLISNNNIHSVNTHYDDNHLFPLSKITSVPNNTPIQSPLIKSYGTTVRNTSTSPDLVSMSTTPTDLSLLSSPNSVDIILRNNNTIYNHYSLLNQFIHQYYSISSPIYFIKQKESIVEEPPTKQKNLFGNGQRQFSYNDNGGCDNSGIGNGNDNREQQSNPLNIMNRSNNMFARSTSNVLNSSSSMDNENRIKIENSEHIICNKSEEQGLHPNDFHFNSSKDVTDPYVKHENNEKITISSWVNSKYGDEIYSLMEKKSPVKDNTRANSSNSENSESSSVENQNRTATATITISNNLTTATDNNSKSSDEYIPPMPPKFINSKLDGLRSRVLNDPKQLTPRHHDDDDLGTAAAVLSIMRSSPFRFSDKAPPSSASSASSSKIYSRPHSSSFSSSSLKNHTRPLLRINQREEENNGNIIHPAVTDVAISDSDDDKSVDENSIDNNQGKFSNINHLRTKEVTWNKNGKRIDRRLSTSDLPRVLKKSKKPTMSTIKPKLSKKANKDEIGFNEFITEEKNIEKHTNVIKTKLTKTSTNSKLKSNSGTRSRTGCWICRLRKKKCTEEKPSCHNCERLNLDCLYYDEKPDFVTDPIKKKEKLQEIKICTREAKRKAMKKKA